MGSERGRKLDGGGKRWLTNAGKVMLVMVVVGIDGTAADIVGADDGGGDGCGRNAGRGGGGGGRRRDHSGADSSGDTLSGDAGTCGNGKL